MRKPIVIGCLIVLMLSLWGASKDSKATSSSYRSSQSKVEYISGNVKAKTFTFYGKVRNATAKGSIRLIRLIKSGASYEELAGKNIVFPVKSKGYKVTFRTNQFITKLVNGYYEVQVYLPKNQSHIIFVKVKSGRIVFFKSSNYKKDTLALNFVKALGTGGTLSSVANNEFVNSPSSMKVTTAQYDEIKQFTTKLCKLGDTQYEKTRTIYQWVTRNIYYNIKKANANDNGNNNPYYVFKKRYGVCEGYARLLREMLSTQGIPAVYISGDTANGMLVKTTTTAHSWVMIYGDNRWFFADPTWDSFNEYNSKTKKFTKEDATTIYFDNSLQNFAMTHKTKVVEYGVQVNQIPVTFVGGRIVATTYQGESKGITYPSQYKGLKITGIESVYMKSNYQPKVTKIIIPKGYEYFGYYAFQYYNKLQQLYLPKSIVKIQSGMLFSSKKITNVYVYKKTYAYVQCGKMNYKRKVIK